MPLKISQIWPLGLIIILISLNACNLGSGADFANIPQNNIQQISIDNITTIPSNGNNPGRSEYTPLNVNNNSDQAILLDKIQITENGRLLQGIATNAYLNADNCLNLAAHSVCQLKIATRWQSGSYLLALSYHDSNNNRSNISQIISFNRNLANQNGFIYAANDFAIGKGFKKTLSVPFRLAGDYSQLAVKLNNQPVNFSCNQQSYRKDTLCNALIPTAYLNAGKQSNDFEITANSGGASRNNISSRSLLIIVDNTRAHLISSALNQTVSAISPVQIFLSNNGKANATQLQITGSSPFTISAPPSGTPCGSTLLIANTCSFMVNTSNLSSNGESTVAISYFDGLNYQVLYFNIYYFSAVPNPSLSLTTSGSFSNKEINSGPTLYYVNIQNNGANDLTNLQFGSVNSQVSSITANANGTTCFSGQNLAIGASCIMVLAYDPSIITSGTVNFVPTANYVGQGGQTLSYSNSSLSIPYSAVNNANFVAIGDFGMVLSSNSSGVWSALIDSPFATATTNATGLVINNGTYVMPASGAITTAIKYSTQNGLFWQTSGTSNLGTSTCGIVYDGSFYYTCGNLSTSFGVGTNCTTTGRGCVIRSNNLNSTWSPLAQPNTASAIYDIFYFTNGTNNAYLATVTNTTNNNSTILTSSNGSSFINTTSTGFSGNVNNKLTRVVYNPSLVNNQITVWNTVGRNSSAAIDDLSSWTANTTFSNPPVGVINGAVYQNNTYVVANNQGDIYTAASATGSYTRRLNGTATNAFNNLIYGAGTYLAVGVSGYTATTSTPTSTWPAATQTVTIGQNTRPNLTSAYYDGSNFWALGASTLVQSTANPPTSSSWKTLGLHSITQNGSNYLAIDNNKNIYFSSNLTSWSQQTNPSNEFLNAIYCAETNLCFAVGNNGVILKSTDGSTWQSQSSPTSRNLNAIYCQGITCVAVGGNGSASTGTAISSNDENHASWSLAVNNSTLATTNLNGISFFGNLFIAVGNGGVVYTSTNGASWVIRTSNTISNLNAISCNANGGCAAVGNGGTIIFTGFGIIWLTPGATGTTNDLNSVSYSGGFVAVGNRGTIVSSQNGYDTWAAATFPATSSAANNLQAVINQ